MNDRPSPHDRRMSRLRLHLLVAMLLLVHWIGAFLLGQSQGFGAYEASEKATAVAVAGFAAMAVYFLVAMPMDRNDSPMFLAAMPMFGLQMIRPTRTPEPFAHLLAHALLINLMAAVVVGWLTHFWPSRDAGKGQGPLTLRNRRRELEVRPVRSGVVRSYLEAGLTERGQEDAP